ncbi:MAG: serine/threonine-protein kinase [Myxococcota bacterium]
MEDGPEVTGDSALDTAIARPLPVLEGHGEEASTPTRIGKYAVLGLLGRGGMGAVYRAFDADLEREVAVKVLKASFLRDASEAERLSLLREAKALAKLNHPNVVSVYEAGEDRGGFFIAMERVEGDDLRSWLKTRPADRRVIVQRFIEAGRGLLAAHEAGLIHRDFKPANVLLSAQGAKVTDFGLARSVVLDAASSGSSSAEIESDGTAEGTVLGTPAYMSPEQHRGEMLDPASDQYSFCVALYEGLVGKRPFRSLRARAMLRTKLAGMPALPTGVSVPEHLLRVLRRGLAPDPEARFESMATLLRALEFDPAARRRRIAGGAGLVVVGGVAVGVSSMLVGDAPRPCAPDPEAFSEAWDEPAARAVEAALVGTGRAYAPAAFAQVRARLDVYVEAWTRMRVEACEATVVEQAQSQRVLDMRVACLDERRASVRVLTRALRRDASGALDHVDSMMRSLPSLSTCANLEQLEAEVPDPAVGIAAAVAEARERLATARVLNAAGRFQDADVELAALLPDVKALNYDPLTAETMLERGRVLDRMAQHREAQAALEQATWLAYGADVQRVVAQGATQLVWNVSDAQSRGAEGKVWLELADAAARRLEDEVLLRAEIANARGVLLQDLGEDEGARASFERVLSLLADGQGHDRLHMAGALVNLAILESDAGRFEAALALQQRALELRETYEGREHPNTATLLNNMSTVLSSLERIDEATAANAEALARLRARYGEAHPLVGTALVQTATLAFMRDETEEAVRLLREAAAAFEAARGPEHRDLVVIYTNIGLIERDLKHFEAAVEALQRAVSVAQANYGSDHARTKAAQAELDKVVAARTEP